MQRIKIVRINNFTKIFIKSVDRFSEFSRVFQGTAGFDKHLRVASATTEFHINFQLSLTRHISSLTFRALKRTAKLILSLRDFKKFSKIKKLRADQAQSFRKNYSIETRKLFSDFWRGRKLP